MDQNSEFFGMKGDLNTPYIYRHKKSEISTCIVVDQTKTVRSTTTHASFFKWVHRSMGRTRSTEYVLLRAGQEVLRPCLVGVGKNFATL
jgi:hypothetical protein